jgi:ribosomal protein S12 methylthiotransferase
VHLGCARNLIDSELLLARLAERDLIVTGDVDAAHTVVLNTCSFIGPAREESYRAIEDLLEKKKRGDIERVVVAGCLVERYKKELSASYPGVDSFAEISDYSALATSVRSMIDGESFESYHAADGLRPADRDGARLLATPASYAYLRISHGCDHKCGFCAIPSIRGPHRSKTLEAVLSEAEELIRAGTRELVLVAEDSTAWGRESGTDLAQLVEALAEMKGVDFSDMEHEADWRLRVMYAYPNRFPWGLLPLLADHPRVQNYLDIPMQHASTSMLRAMRRAGDGRIVRETFDRLRNEAPGITLRTTVLLGYPGETDADVDELLELMRTYRLGRLGGFTYSPEQGTSGYDLPDRVPAKDAQVRLDAVLALRDQVLEEEQRLQIGKTLSVLVDEAVEGGDEVAVGRSEMDAPEVDPLVVIEAGDRAQLERLAALNSGDRITVSVHDVDEERNLRCSLTD